MLTEDPLAANPEAGFSREEGKLLVLDVRIPAFERDQPPVFLGDLFQL